MSHHHGVENEIVQELCSTVHKKIHGLAYGAWCDGNQVLKFFMKFVETITHLAPTSTVRYAVDTEHSPPSESSFCTKSILFRDRILALRIQTSVLQLELNRERVEYDVGECLLEQIECLEVEDQLFVFAMSSQGTAFRVVVDDWSQLDKDSLERLEPFLFQIGISPVCFHFTDIESCVVSLANGQLHTFVFPLDSSTPYVESELRDNSYIGQIRSIVQTPVKFINSFRNSAKARTTGIEQQALGITSFHFERTHLCFVLHRSGSLSVWNTLTKECLKSISMDTMLVQYQFSEMTETFGVRTSKVLEVFGSYSTEGGIGGQLLLHLPFSYQPLFIAIGFKIDLNGNSIEFAFEKYLVVKTYAGQLLDFVIIPEHDISDTVTDFLLFTLWDSQEQSILYTRVNLEKDDLKSCRWFTCHTVDPVTSPVIDITPGESLDGAYMDFVFQSNIFPLDLIALCSDYPSSKSLVVEDLYEHVLQHISSKTMGTDDRLSSESEAWHRFVSELVEFRNSDIESYGLFYDSLNHRISVLKQGDRVGYIRCTDVIEVLQSTDDLYTVANELDFYGSLESLKEKGFRTSFSHVRTLIEYVTTELCSTIFMDEIATEMLVTVKEVGLDDFSAQVYDRIREQFMDNEDDWRQHLRNIERIVSNIGSLEVLLDNLIGLFQSPSGVPGEPNFDEHFAAVVTNSLQRIVSQRYAFIQQLFFCLVLVKHLEVTVPFQRHLYVNWFSLYSNYVRIDWFARQYHIRRPPLEMGLERLSLSRPSDSPMTLLEFYIRNFIHIELSSPNWSDQVIEASHQVLGGLGLTTVNQFGSLEESSPVLSLANTLMQVCPAVQVMELMDLIPICSPAHCVLMGRIWLELNEVEKAKIAFSKGASGVGNADSDLGIVISSLVLQNGVSAYYEDIMRYCTEKNCSELCIYFGKLALQYFDHSSTQRIELLKIVFNMALNYDDFDSAYELLLQIDDKDQQKFCLGSLVGRLCEVGFVNVLCTRYTFTGMTKEVEETLLFKARTELATVAPAAVLYHQICFAYFSYRHSFRTGMFSSL
jgi:hypothetical protein